MFYFLSVKKWGIVICLGYTFFALLQQTNVKTLSQWGWSVVRTDRKIFLCVLLQVQSEDILLVLCPSSCPYQKWPGLMSLEHPSHHGSQSYGASSQPGLCNLRWRSSEANKNIKIQRYQCFGLVISPDKCNMIRLLFWRKLKENCKIFGKRTWSILAHPPYFLDFLVLNWWIWLKFGAKSCKFRRLLWKNKEKIHLEIFYPPSRSFFGNMIDESVCLQTQYSDLYFVCTAWIRYWLTI